MVMTTEPHENLNILYLMDSLSPNFNGGSKSNVGGSCDANFNSNLLFTT